MQNFFNNFPNNLKVLLAIGFGMAMVLGIVNIDDFSGFTRDDPSTEAKTTEVKFVVQGENQQPVEGAKVQFIFDGAPETRSTNTSGYVRLSIPLRDDIDVVISKEGYKTINTTLNLKADSSRTRTILMEKNSFSSSSSDEPDKIQIESEDDSASDIKTQQKSKIVSTRGFDFEFTGCEAISTDEFTCGFIVVNNQQPRTLQLFTQGSRLIDNKGNVFPGSLSKLGGGDSGYDSLKGKMGDSAKLPTGVPIRGEILFRIMTSGATVKINYIEFNFSQFTIEFTPVS